MNVISDIIELFSPRLCCCCNQLLVGDERLFCTRCLLQLPETLQVAVEGNTTEQRLCGYTPIESAYSHLFFSKGNITQNILHKIKYKGNYPLAIAMGRQMGIAIAQSHRFDTVDVLVPVPLHPIKRWKRGYNQSEMLCKGIVENFKRPLATQYIYRQTFTQTQTKKDHLDRFDNMQHVFRVKNPKKLIGKHLLLVDDMMTTGATIGACIDVLHTIPDIKISVATLAITAN